MAYKAPADLHPPRKPPQAGQPQTIHAQEPRLDLGAEGLLAGAVSSNRRRSSTKVPGLKRAVSSPNVRGEASGESMPLSPLDKKRNKLGYHRTAVACGHCRRRKIRCIPATDDTTGRCQNCIRLKKECHFFPVDQQDLSPGSLARSSSKAEATVTEGEESVSSSSPRVLASSTLDQIKNVNGQIGTPPLTDDGSGYQSFGGHTSSQEYGAAHDYDYRHGYNVPPPHMYQYPSHSHPRTHFDAGTSQYYSSQEQLPLQSPYTSPPLSGSMRTSPQADTHEFPQPSPRGNDFSWAPHPPIRSLSIADTQDLHSMYPAYRSNTFPSIPHRMGGPGEATHIPHANPGIIPSNPQQGNFSHQFPPSSYQQMPMGSTMAWTSTIPTQMAHNPVSSSDRYQTSWYPAATNLPYVREEDDSVHPPSSNYPGHQQFRPNPG